MNSSDNQKSQMVSTAEGNKDGSGVQTNAKSVEVVDRVELIDCIAKSVSLVYSINAAILLTRKKLLKHAVASPPLGTKALWRRRS